MKSPLSDFWSIFRQSHNSFEGEESGEEVILLLRRHPFVILIRLAFSIALLFVPVIAGAVFAEFISSHNLIRLFMFLTGVWCLLLWQVIFYALTMYTLDVWIVTNRRIIDSTQHGFFNRTISELHISRIQDISVSTKGFIPTILHFGDLQVQTAGTEEKFLFMQIPKPEKVKDVIMRIASSI
jgi:uncharacterized membrane protein YdbT with pleckstrin-like domain